MTVPLYSWPIGDTGASPSSAYNFGGFQNEAFFRFTEDVSPQDLHAMQISTESVDICMYSKLPFSG